MLHSSECYVISYLCGTVARARRCYHAPLRAEAPSSAISIISFLLVRLSWSDYELYNVMLYYFESRTNKNVGNSLILRQCHQTIGTHRANPPVQRALSGEVGWVQPSKDNAENPVPNKYQYQNIRIPAWGTITKRAQACASLSDKSRCGRQ